MKRQIYWLLGAAVLIAVILLPPVLAGSEPSALYYVPTGEKAVAFTFDVLWERGPVEELLAVLDRKNVQATFFLTGLWAERYREEANMIKNAGHELGNHTYSHEDLEKISPERVSKQIQDGLTTIEEVTGVRVKLFRPPFGSWNRSILDSCRELDQSIILWDVEAGDWVQPEAALITARVTERVDRGSIVLFHISSDQTIAALPEIIDQLRQQGYEIVTVGRLLEMQDSLPQAPYRKQGGGQEEGED